MPLFNKQAHELNSHFDKWLYFLKHLDNFDHIPSVLNEPIFEKGFEIAELSQLTPRQLEAYQKSLLAYSEVKNVSDTAFGEGKIEGKIEGKKEVAKEMLAKGFDLKIISELTGLSEADIEKL